MKKTLLLFAGIFSLTTLSYGQNTWYVKPGGGGAMTGANWNDAYAEIGYAMMTASPGDHIWVAEGTYYPSIDQTGNWFSNTDGHFWFKQGVTVLGGFVGTEVLESQRDPINHKANLSGNGMFNNVVKITTNGVTLDGFKIWGGFSDLGAVGIGSGAGINIGATSQVTLRNLEVSNNTAYDHGGGAYISNSTEVLIENCRFNNNNTTNYDGAGIYFNASDATLNNCLFYWNSANRFGGAITTVSASIDVNNCTFYENSGGTNGFQHSTSGVIRYNHSIFDNVNDFPGLDLATSGSASVTFNESLISPDLYFPATKNSCVTAHASFTDAAANDYTQLSNSAGVEMVISLPSSNFTTEDLAGNTRLIGSYMDLGAYELCTAQASISQNGANLVADQPNATYQWYNCTTSSPIAGATSQTYTATANGDYYVTVSYGSGCSETSNCVTVNSISQASLEDNAMLNFSVYPNPTEDKVFITGDVNFDTVVLTDVAGNVILKTNQTVLSLEGMPQGIYFITILSSGNSSTKRVIKI